MNKKIILIITLCTAIGLLTFFQNKQEQSTSIQHTIGILQTASHPALDNVREGFIQEIKNQLGDSVHFIIQNAQGSVSQAHTIAQQFKANKKIDALFAIATPAAQALYATEKERPLFIAAITDPHSLGLIHPTTNVCGTTDMIDIDAVVEMVTHFIPEAKNVGILYTSGETNSIILAQHMRSSLEKKDIVVSDFTITSEADVQALVESACRKVDVLLCPTDNTVACTIPLIASIALKYKKPLFVSDNTLISAGALASRGVDYKESGKQTAALAAQVILEKKKPYELPLEQAKSEKILVNGRVLLSLGLTVPEAIKQDVTVLIQ